MNIFFEKKKGRVKEKWRRLRTEIGDPRIFLLNLVSNAKNRSDKGQRRRHSLTINKRTILISQIQHHRLRSHHSPRQRTRWPSFILGPARTRHLQSHQANPQKAIEIITAMPLISSWVKTIQVPLIFAILFVMFENVVTVVVIVRMREDILLFVYIERKMDALSVEWVKDAKWLLRWQEKNWI